MPKNILVMRQPLFDSRNDAAEACREQPGNLQGAGLNPAGSGPEACTLQMGVSGLFYKFVPFFTVLRSCFM